MLNPNTIFRKTELGNMEVASRKLGLRAELRRLLILIDGRNTAGKLAVFVRMPEIDMLLYELQALGLIDPLDGNVESALAPPSAAPVAAPAAQSPSGESALMPTNEQFIAARTAAVRFINDKLGPSGETLAVKLERTRNAQELREAVAAVRQSLERMVGANSAQAFLEHVRTSVKI